MLIGTPLLISAEDSSFLALPPPPPPPRPPKARPVNFKCGTYVN